MPARAAAKSIKFDYPPAKLHPIPVRGIMHRLHVDLKYLKGPMHVPENNQGHKCIAVAEDSLRKWPEAQPLPTKLLPPLQVS